MTQRPGFAPRRIRLFGMWLGLGCAFIAAALAAQDSLPPKAKATLDKALAVTQKGLLHKAETLYEKAAQQIGQPSFEVQYGLSRVYLLRGDQDQSLVAAERALGLSRNSVHEGVSLNQIGILHWLLAYGSADIPTEGPPAAKARDAHLERSVAVFRRSIEVSAGRFPAPLFNLAEALYSQGHVAEASEWLTRYMAEAPPEGMTPRVTRLASCLELLAGETPENPVHEAGQGMVSRPTRISGGGPRYTVAARQRRVRGHVVLESVIDRQGEVICVRPLLGLPFGLTQAAIDALTSWKFEPATLNGEPVPVFYNLTINFRLKGR